MMNLPIIAIDYPGGFYFCRVHYEKKEKIYSKWIKSLKQHKKWKYRSRQHWLFYPIGICPKKFSIEQKDQKYVFLVRFLSEENGEYCSRYTGRIETTFDGFILDEQS